MRPPTPLELCAQIASEHAANMTAAITEERAARLAARLEDYSNAVSDLAGDDGDPLASRANAAAGGAPSTT